MKKRNRLGVGILCGLPLLSALACVSGVLIAKEIDIKNTFTITFNTRVEEQIEPVKVKKGQCVTQPADPYKQFCKVKYWYRDDKNVPYDFSTPVTESFTLSAYYTAAVTTVNVKGLNFSGVAGASNFDDFADMYAATKQVVQNTLGGFTLGELIDDASKFKEGFTDIEETDTEIRAKITYELYTKEGETLNIYLQ